MDKVFVYVVCAWISSINIIGLVCSMHESVFYLDSNPSFEILAHIVLQVIVPRDLRVAAHYAHTYLQKQCLCKTICCADF